MIQATIYARYSNQKAFVMLGILPEIISISMKDYGYEVTSQEISVKVEMITINGCMLAEHEIEIVADKNDALSLYKNEICEKIANSVYERTKAHKNKLAADDLIVRLNLCEMGFHRLKK